MAEFLGILEMNSTQKLSEFTYEIMVVFIDLKIFQIQLQICFSEGECFAHLK